MVQCLERAGCPSPKKKRRYRGQTPPKIASPPLHSLQRLGRLTAGASIFGGVWWRLVLAQANTIPTQATLMLLRILGEGFVSVYWLDLDLDLDLV